MKITVRKIQWRHINYSAPFSVRLDNGNDFPVVAAWRILDDGIDTGNYVVDVRHGRTIVDSDGKMLTSWHIGISPGDLARLISNPDPSF